MGSFKGLKGVKEIIWEKLSHAKAIHIDDVHKDDPSWDHLWENIVNTLLYEFIEENENETK